MAVPRMRTHGVDITHTGRIKRRKMPISELDPAETSANFGLSLIQKL